MAEGTPNAGGTAPEEVFAQEIETNRREAIACAERAFMTATRLADFDRALFDRVAGDLVEAQFETARWSMVEHGIDAPLLLDHVRRAIMQSFTQRARDLLAAVGQPDRGGERDG